MTYSIVAVAPGGRYLGVATASGSAAVGSRVPWARYPVAAVATQAYTNPSLGPKVIELVGRGLSAEEALRRCLSIDPNPELRQVAVVSIGGGSAVHSGSGVPRESGQYVGRYSVCVANLVADPGIASEACEVFEEGVSRTLKGFVKSMLKALERAHELGGDRRGDRSSAILVTGLTEYMPYYDRLVDLRVDYSENPIGELERLARVVLDIH